MSLPQAYVDNYNQIAKDHVEYWRETGLNPFQDEAVLRRNERRTASLIRKWVPAGGWVLDVGCGMGDLLLLMEEHGYATLGYEIAQPYLDVCRERGLEVEQEAIEFISDSVCCFDAVVATDVLEHVIDLHAAATELMRVLRPGGYLIVRVPNMEPVSWTEKYEYVHLRILDEGTLRILFSKLLGGDVVYAEVEGAALDMVVMKNP